MYPSKVAQAISYQAWQSHRHALGECDPVCSGVNIVADSNKTQTSTAEAAWTFDNLADFETWLQTEYHATDKDGKPLYYTTKDGKKITTTEVTPEPVMKLPSAPNVGANIGADWQHALLHHPLARQHTEYSEDLARMSRYGVYLVLAEADGSLKVPKEVQAAFSEWYKAFEDEQSARLSVARAGAKEANERRAKAEGQLNAQQTRVAQMLADGLITPELADAILGGQTE